MVQVIEKLAYRLCIGLGTQGVSEGVPNFPPFLPICFEPIVHSLGPGRTVIANIATGLCRVRV